MSTVYDSPEQYGLKLVAEIDFDYDDWGFNILAVWRHESGKLYVGEDSGCSCPAPFEDFQSLTDLQVFDLDSVVREVKQANGATAEMRAAFLRKIRRAAKG